MRRSEEDYRGDVVYDVWRSGGNPDYVSYDRVSDHYWNGNSTEYAASCEMRLQRPREPEPEDYYQEQQYPDQEFPDMPEEEDPDAS
jgi:hypothetical protein